MWFRIMKGRLIACHIKIDICNASADAILEIAWNGTTQSFLFFGCLQTLQHTSTYRMTLNIPQPRVQMGCLGYVPWDCWSFPRVVENWTDGDWGCKRKTECGWWVIASTCYWQLIRIQSRITRFICWKLGFAEHCLSSHLSMIYISCWWVLAI